MPGIDEITSEIVRFRDEREWKQFHRPKDMALSLLLEAAELAEVFQWKSDSECESLVKTNCNALADELADVLYWTLLMSHDFKIDIVQAFQAKMEKNRAKYPVESSKGSSAKYSEQR